MFRQRQKARIRTNRTSLLNAAAGQRFRGLCAGRRVMEPVAAAEVVV